MKKLILIAFFSCIILIGCKNNYNNNLRVDVSLDSRVELVAIMCYLSGYEEYNKSQITSYKSEVDNYFKDFRNHEAIIFMKDIREKYQTGYSDPMCFAVYLTDSLTPSVSFDKLPKDFNPQWDEKIFYQLAELVKKFAIDTKFSIFFQAQNKRYENEITEIENKVNSSLNFDWFTSFFGKLSQDAKFQIIVCLNNGSSNYGSHTQIGDEKKYFSISGAHFNSQKISIDNSTIIHEFCHSFCNPIIDEYKTKLEKTGGLVYNDYISRKHQKAYSTWETVFYETFVRTSVSCYLRDNGSFGSSWLNNNSDKKQGFMWIHPLTDSFSKLNKKGTVYESKDLYMDVLIHDLNEYLKTRKKTVHNII